MVARERELEGLPPPAAHAARARLELRQRAALAEQEGEAGGLAALDALETADWDVFTQRPRPSRARLAREAALVLVR